MINFKCTKSTIALLLLFPFLSTPIATAQFEPVLSIEVNPIGGVDVQAAEISPDGSKIITATRVPIVWNAITGERILTFTANTANYIRSVAFANDNYTVATGDGRHNAFIWNIRTGDVLQRVTGYDMDPTGGGITGVAFTPDGTKLLTGDGNGALQLWDVKTGQEIKRYRDQGGIETLFILPDGNRFVIWRAGAVVIIDLYNDQSIKIISGAYPSLSSDGQILQIRASRNGPLIQQWDMSTYELIREYVYEPGQIVGIPTISPDGKNFLIGAIINTQLSRTSNRELYDTTTRSLLRQYPVDRISSSNSPLSRDLIIKYFFDGRRFLTVNGGTVHIWDISDVVTCVEDAFLH